MLMEAHLSQNFVKTMFWKYVIFLFDGIMSIETKIY